MNVGELLKERDRLMEVIAEAKTARGKLTQLNKTIALFSDDNVDLLPESNITKMTPKGTIKSRQYRRQKGVKPRYAKVKCPKCNKTFTGPQGLGRHMLSHKRAS